jgi:hypothetical protein
VRVLVHGLVGRGRGEAEVRGDVDEARLRARAFGGLEQRVDERRGGAVRRAQNTADVGSFAISAAISACDLNAVSPSAPARCGNDLPASSPGELSDITPASVKFGWPRIRRSSSPDT